MLSTLTMWSLFVTCGLSRLRFILRVMISVVFLCSSILANLLADVLTLKYLRSRGLASLLLVKVPNVLSSPQVL